MDEIDRIERNYVKIPRKCGHNEEISVPESVENIEKFIEALSSYNCHKCFDNGYNRSNKLP